MQHSFDKIRKVWNLKQCKVLVSFLRLERIIDVSII